MIKAFNSGFCVAGNHQHCRGALHRPNDDEGNERVWYCRCKCHRGQEVAPPERIKPTYQPHTHNAELLYKWVAELQAFGKIDIELPETDEELKSMKSRMSSAKTRAKVDGRLKMSIENGRLVGKVVPLKKAKKAAKRKKVQ